MILFPSGFNVPSNIIRSNRGYEADRTRRLHTQNRRIDFLCHRKPPGLIQ